MKTQVAIIGAGPSGMLLGHLLQRAGISSIILENRNENFLRLNKRGGMIEADIAEYLVANGAGERLNKKGIKVDQINFHINGEKKELKMSRNGDNHPVLYNQHDLISDLIELRKATDQPIIFEGKGQRYEGIDTTYTTIHYTLDAALHSLECEYVVGCDGYSGISRHVIPKSSRNEVKKDLPYAWLDWLVDAEPSTLRPIYGISQDGFVMQTPTSDGMTRLHLQIDRGTEVRDLPDEEEIWKKIEQGLEIKVNKGKVIQRKLDYMRQFHTDNMQHEHLYIAGDAAHMVERTGSKGLNMALADAIYLAEALIANYKNNDPIQLEKYTQRCLDRNRKVKEFTSRYTELLHINSDHTEEQKMQQFEKIKAQLDDTTSRGILIQNLIGLPL